MLGGNPEPRYVGVGVGSAEQKPGAFDVVRQSVVTVGLRVGVTLPHIAVLSPGEAPHSKGRADALCAEDGLRIIGWIRAVLHTAPGGMLAPHRPSEPEWLVTPDRVDPALLATVMY